MKSTIIYLLLFLSLSLSALLLYLHVKSTKKTAFVTTLKVFEEFKYKKELETDYKRIQMIKQAYLDSLKLNIQSLSAMSSNASPMQEERINNAKKAYLLKENQFNEENENLYNTYNERIWKQLNQYMADFGKEKGYDYLFGASGQGNILFSAETNDATKEITDYINNKYSGKKTD